MAAPSLLEILATVPDPRSRHGRIHPLTAILALTVLAMLRGCRGPTAIAGFGRDHGAPLAHALGFTRGKTPCPACLSTLFRRLDATALEAALTRWIAARLPEGQLPISLDGKTLRGSKGDDAPGQHLVAAYAPHAEAVLAQVRVDAKTNEHKAALELLGILPVQGRIVLGDALFCQRDVCAEIIGQGGDYLFFAKDNQPGLKTDIGAGLGYEAAARAVAAAFSPRRTGAGARACGARRGQGAWPAGGADVAGDEYPDAARQVAGAEAGLRVDAQADGEGSDDGGSGVRGDQPDGGGSGRRAAAGTGARALGDRE